MYYARTNRAAHVGPSWESVRPSPRAPPSRRGSPRRSTSRCSLSLSTISQAQFSPGDRPVRRWSGTIHLEPGFAMSRRLATRWTQDSRVWNEVLFVVLSRTRSFVLICSCSAVRCGWLVLMRITIDHVCPSVSMISVVIWLFLLVESDNWTKLGEEPGVVKAIHCIFWR